MGTITLTPYLHNSGSQFGPRKAVHVASDPLVIVIPWQNSFVTVAHGEISATNDAPQLAGLAIVGLDEFRLVEPERKWQFAEQFSHRECSVCHASILPLASLFGNR